MPPLPPYSAVPAPVLNVVKRPSHVHRITCFVFSPVFRQKMKKDTGSSLIKRRTKGWHICWDRPTNTLQASLKWSWLTRERSEERRTVALHTAGSQTLKMKSLKVINMFQCQIQRQAKCWRERMHQRPLNWMIGLLRTQGMEFWK